MLCCVGATLILATAARGRELNFRYAEMSLHRNRLHINPNHYSIRPSNTYSISAFGT